MPLPRARPRHLTIRLVLRPRHGGQPAGSEWSPGLCPGPMPMLTALTIVPMRWWPIGLAIVLPTILALIVARLFWSKDSTVGNIMGSAVIAAAMIGFISREYVDLDQQRRACVAREVSCAFRPS